ncbi:MAG: EAL domain-containing protein [Candidatus Omnitrophica bacterium]|nr:EAL domain-containing protein [Candidatus Omnitrophota bacterium]
MQQNMSPSKYVLLVDDEKPQARILSMLLETRGYDVETAFSGVEAFKKISPDCDIVILDLILPDINGFEICRRLKQDKELKHIPVIILSAYSVTEDKLKSFYLGADDFIAKPCEHEELFARMDAILRRHDGGILPAEDKIVTELHRILSNRDVVSYYQPIYQLQPFELLGFETLTRPVTTGHMQNPEQFFKMALQYGVYPEMELMAWANAFAAIAETKFTGKVFLNCNPYFIESVSFARVRTLLERFKIDPNNVILEITEMSAIPDFALFYQHLKPYKEYGLSFAIDDLGRGYASLESLVEIHPNYVKIDGYIIRDLYRDDLKRSIVEFVVGFCKQHGILVVAEGIETQRDLDAARNLGLKAGQGYYFCKPQSQLSLQNFNALAQLAKFQPNGNLYSI